MGPVPSPAPAPAPAPGSTPGPSPGPGTCSFLSAGGNSASNAIFQGTSDPWAQTHVQSDPWSRNLREGATNDRHRHLQSNSCVFPFIYIDPDTYEEITFTSCTAHHDPEGKSWCSTHVNVEGYHQKGSWRHCTSSDVGYTPTTTSGAGAVWGKSNMAFANANAWADLNNQAGARNAGPPQCVDTVTRESIACWVSTALQQSCTSDCLLPERTKLQNIAQRCTPSGLPQCVRDCACVNQAVNPEQRACFARHVTSTNDACISDCQQSSVSTLRQLGVQCGAAPTPTPVSVPVPSPSSSGGRGSMVISTDRGITDTQVVILPKCYSSCPGTDQVLSSGLNCQSLKQWADTLGLTSRESGTEYCVVGDSQSIVASRRAQKPRSAVRGRLLGWHAHLAVAAYDRPAE